LFGYGAEILIELRCRGGIRIIGGCSLRGDACLVLIGAYFDLLPALRLLCPNRSDERQDGRQ
jgi:hypothetical protein